MASNETHPKSLIPMLGLISGPCIVALLLAIGAPSDLADGAHAPPAWIALALLSLMAIWWVTEAVPIPVTSLLPLVVVPLSGIGTMAEAATPYMHPIVVLLLGGFIFAKAIENWGLHERIALNVVSRSGGSPAGLIGGFMVAAALLSMWISNSATSIMMMPIAISVAVAIGNGDEHRHHDFTLALLLGIAYGCSIGGLGTPVGTPTNLIVMGYLNEHGNREIGFSQWMMLGLPVVALLLPLAWLSLTRWSFKMPNLDVDSAKEKVADRIEKLGPTSIPERRTLIVFGVIASLWIFRRSLNQLEIPIGADIYMPFAGLTDQVTAIIAVLACFIVPAGGKNRRSQKLLSWDVAETIPWGVLLLFGGGMSLAHTIASTGLSVYIGESLAPLTALPTLLIIVLITSVVLALTEVTSNIATASALMPVLGALAFESGLPLEMMAAPVALAASCAFMLPMATGPNAVVFATRKVSLATMAKTGFRINLIAVVVITIIAYFLAPLVLA